MESFNEVLKTLSAHHRTSKNLKEVLLANLAMMGEIPAPTFGEQARIDFLANRFKESKLQQQWVDECGNAIGCLEGSNGKKNIVLVAHADTVFSKDLDHTLQVEPNRVTGPGVADNSLGLAALATLPIILKNAGITFKNNLILAGVTKSLGRGNLKGLRFFLSDFNKPIKAGISLEGAQLGRISHTSIGMLRGKIQCAVPDKYDWSRFDQAGAVLTINELINQINKIETPQRPRSRIVLGSIRAGSSFTPAKHATLRFEIRSESLEIVQSLNKQLKEITEQIAAKSADTVELEIFARRKPGGTDFTHPLVRNARKILEALNIESKPGPSTSAVSSFIDREIPAITLGITKGTNLRNKNESIEIEPMFTGLAQILGIIQAIDEGFCEENR